MEREILPSLPALQPLSNGDNSPGIVEGREMCLLYLSVFFSELQRILLGSFVKLIRDMNMA